MQKHACPRIFALHAFNLMSFKFKSSQVGGRRCAGFTSAGCLVLLLLQAQHANAVRSMLLTSFFIITICHTCLYCFVRTVCDVIPLSALSAVVVRCDCSAPPRAAPCACRAPSLHACAVVACLLRTVSLNWLATWPVDLMIMTLRLLAVCVWLRGATAHVQQQRPRRQR